jgi:mono/diheme cytochrome c family protein
MRHDSDCGARTRRPDLLTMTAHLTGSLALCLALACGLAQSQDEPRNPYPLEPRWIDMGRGIYARFSCPMCHGPNARGGAGPDLTDERWIFQPSDRMLFNVIKYGRRGTMMPGYADELADEQIWLVVSYLREQEALRRMESRDAVSVWVGPALDLSTAPLSTVVNLR